MKTHFIYTLLFCLLPFLVNSQNRKQKVPPCDKNQPTIFTEHIIQFEESAWTAFIYCDNCIECFKQMGDMKERSKTLTFFCNNIFIGSIDLLESHLLDCDSIQYSITNSVNFNLEKTKPGSLPRVLDAVFDKIFECYTNPYRLERSDTTYKDLDFMEAWFFLPKKELLSLDNINKEWIELHQVDEKPIWRDCQNQKALEKRENCTEDNLRAYVYQKLRYPAVARENGTEGTVIASFIINTDGFVSDIQILRDIGNECGEVTYNIIEDMLIERVQWIPAKIAGNPVPVRYLLPVQFRLL